MRLSLSMGRFTGSGHLRCGSDHGSAVAVAPSAHADVDTDFADERHGYGIYGQRDYNAWLAKITCRRAGQRVRRQCREVRQIPVAPPATGHQHRANVTIPAAALSDSTVTVTNPAHASPPGIARDTWIRWRASAVF